MAQRMSRFRLLASCLLSVASLAATLAASAAPAEPQPTEVITHTVAPGDTLYSLSRRYGTTVAALQALNGLSDTLIRIGQVLRIPVSQAASPPGEAEGGTGGGVTGAPAPQTRAVAAFQPADGPVAGRAVSLAPEELELLARLVDAEAGGEPFLGQVGVAAVVLNRLRSPGFPSSLSAIVWQPGQFKAVADDRLPARPSASAREAARLAALGVDPTGGALFFFNPVKAVARDFWQTRTVLVTIGQHAFAR